MARQSGRSFDSRSTDRSLPLCLTRLESKHRGSWHLYGHSHGRLPEVPNSLSMDVGVDTHDFRPWHFDEIKAAMNERTRLREEGPKGFAQ